MTKVTVVIPCHNDGAYIDAALHSVREQTYHDVETIIVNDHSTDSVTLSTLERIRSQGITILDSVRRGPAAARNIGITVAMGDYILPLDADDIIEPTYVAAAAAILDAQPAVGICFSDVRLFGLKNALWKFRSADVDRILLGETIITSASMFRKSEWLAVGGFNEELVHGYEDFAFWLSLLEHGCTAYHISEPMLRYRVKPRSRSARLFQEHREQDAALQVFSLYRHLYEQHVETFFKAYRALHEERAQRECLVLWKLMSPLLRLEWRVRQHLKRFLGRA